EAMGERRHLLEAEHGARALDGVQRPEGGVDQAAVARRGLEVQERLLELFEQVLRFLAECVGGVDRGHAPRTFFTTARSWSCWNGLTIQPVAPASFACCLMPASDSVVRKTIGRPRWVGSLRSSRMKVRPSITGMLRSVMIMCTGVDWALASPS